jgi:hypothetical protein
LAGYPQAMFEWNRLLKLGGKLTLQTMYINGLLRKFEYPSFQTIKLQKLLIVNLFSMQKYEGDFHLSTFTERLMRYYLWMGGCRIDRIEVLDDWLFSIDASKIADLSMDDLVKADMPTKEFLSKSYIAVLKRQVDEIGLRYLKVLDNGSLTRANLIRELFLSEENMNRLENSAPDFEMLFHERGLHQN